MRRLILGSCLLVHALTGGPPAWGAYQRDEATPGAGVVGGTPVAVVVRGPGGELGGYRSRGGGSGPVWSCGYHELIGSEGAVLPNVEYRYTVVPQPGRGYAFICTDEHGRQVHAELLVYNPAEPLGGLFAAERAAELAIERLELADPVIVLNPPGAQLVGVPTWLHLDTPWGPQQASASVAGVTSTVTATPTTVTWDLGDGTHLTCHGPGTAFDPTRPAATQHPDCTHTYTQPSHTRPGGTYPLSATITYRASWQASTGTGGDLGTLTRTSATTTTVHEAQALIH